MAPRDALTAEQLREVLNYDPSTGFFTWKKMDRRHWLLGTIAGARHSGGYIRIYVRGREYYGHRLAWLFVHGDWPPEQIDHINGIRTDNRIDNLRPASATENLRNTKRRKNNTSGCKGVSQHSTSRRWRARIVVNRVENHLGFFDTKEEAIAAYKHAAAERFGPFATAR